MKKTIKLRFVKENEHYLVQRKTFLGWKYITYTIFMGYGSVVNYFNSESKEELLKEILEEYYKIDKRFVTIIEYPSLSKY